MPALVRSFNTANRSSFTSAIGDIAEYSGVSAGTLTINGQNIAIDPATTTIRDLVGAINAVAGVGASVNETNGGIDIWSESASASLKLTDTSGVLGALGDCTGHVLRQRSACRHRLRANWDVNDVERDRRRGEDVGGDHAAERGV